MDSMINQSLVNVEVPGELDEGGLNMLSIEKIKNKQYESAVNIYSKLIRDEGETFESWEELNKEFVDAETERLLLALPEEDAERIVEFVKRVMRIYPKEALEGINIPLNERHLKALFAAAYKWEHQKNNGEVEGEDLYIRILAALSIYDRHIGTRFDSAGVGTTLNAIERYKSQIIKGNNFLETYGGVRGAVGNTAIRVIAATMPIVEPPSYGGNRSEKLPYLRIRLDEFQKNVSEEMSCYEKVLKDLCERYFPGRKIRHSKALPVFVRDIVGEVPISNIEKITDMTSYLDSPASGVTAGNDTVTGLSLTFIEQPIDWDESVHPQSDEGILSQNKIHRTAGIMLHERIHEQAEFYVEEMFETIVNELLTDSLTAYVQLRAHGMEFKGENFRHTTPGYVRLVRFAMELVTQGIVSEEDIIKNALNQDPKNFLDKIYEAVRTQDEVAEKLIRIMQRFDMVLPLRSDEVEGAVIKCKEDPETFLRQELEKAIKEFGFTDFSYVLGLMDFVSNVDPSFIQRQRRAWAEKLGKREEDILNSFYLLLDPKTGVYHDRVVELYYVKKQMEGSSNPLPLHLAAYDVYRFVIDAHTRENKAIFSISELHKLPPDRQVECLIAGSNFIHNYINISDPTGVENENGKKELDSQAILEKSAEVVEKLHQGLSEIISAQYPEINNREKEDLIYNLIVKLVPKLGPLDDRIRYTNIDDAAREILTRITILMKGGRDDEWSIPQIIHYGPYVEMDRDLVKGGPNGALKSLRR